MIDLKEWLIQIAFEMELDVRLKTADLLCIVLDKIEDSYQEMRESMNQEWILFHRIGRIWEANLMRGGD